MDELLPLLAVRSSWCFHLMLEMPQPRKDHGYAVSVAGFNGKLIVDGAAGLDNGPDAGCCRGFNHIGEGEKGVRG